MKRLRNEYKKVKLGDIITLKRGFDLPKQERIQGDYPVIASTGVSGYHNSYKVAGPGITTGRSGSLGTVIWENEDFWPLNTTLYVENFHSNDPKFIYYFMQKFPFARYNSGSGVPTLNRNHVHKAIVHLPPLPEQKRIASILSSFDNKIELLRKQNKTLENIAQTIFKQWFIDFNFPNSNGKPYKDNGGKMIDSELGLIPEGWRVGIINEITERITGRVGKDEQDKYKVLSALHTGVLKPSEEHFNKRVASKNIKNYLALTSEDFAYNPARINIGSIGIVDDIDYAAVSPVYIAFKTSSIYQIFLEKTIQGYRFKKYIGLVASGSVRQTVNWDSFKLYQLCIPKDKILEKYNLFENLYISQINSNKIQIDRLCKMKNNLLKKLIL